MPVLNKIERDRLLHACADVGFYEAMLRYSDYEGIEDESFRKYLNRFRESVENLAEYIGYEHY